MTKRTLALEILSILGNKSLFRLYDIFTILLFALYINILAQENFSTNLPIDFILLFKYITSLLSIIFFYLIYHQYNENFESACRSIDEASDDPSLLYKVAINNYIKKYIIYYICFIFFTVTFVFLELKF